MSALSSHQDFPFSKLDSLLQLSCKTGEFNVEMLRTRKEKATESQGENHLPAQQEPRRDFAAPLSSQKLPWRNAEIAQITNCTSQQDVAEIQGWGRTSKAIEGSSRPPPSPCSTKTSLEANNTNLCRPTRVMFKTQHTSKCGAMSWHKCVCQNTCTILHGCLLLEMGWSLHEQVLQLAGLSPSSGWCASTTVI